MKYCYNLKQLFDSISSKYKARIAIDLDDESYTYQDLIERSDLFALYLQKEHIEQGNVIAIASSKHYDDYAMMIACLKSGITYVNLDLDNPQKRLEDIFSNCEPKFVFSKINEENITATCFSRKIKNVLYDNISISDNKPLIEHDVDGDTIAYIMFTSGSTGVPKGVAITHQNIIHFIDWSQNKYNITSEDRFANLSPMYFDNSVFDFYSSLFSGATLVPIKKSLLTKPLDLIEYIDKKKCTIWFSVPSMLIYLSTMRVLNKNNLSFIRIFTFGGEGYPKSELKKLYDMYSHRAKLVNVYGPTEGTCICSSYDISNDDFIDFTELPSLGPINQNFSYVILNQDSVESNIGELCLLGPNIAVGYYNDEERTKKSFSCYSSAQHYQKRMYRTGDLVEEKNGLLYFKGRIDNQIKHMGYRIELEEIEIALDSIHEVERTAVVYRRESSAYGKIIAFVSSNNENLNEKILKQKLINYLPVYMIPNKINILKDLPKNQNGKVDKKKLLKSI